MRVLKGRQTGKDDDNKKQFSELLLTEWSKDEYAPRLQDRQVTLVCDGMAHRLTSLNGNSIDKIIIDSLQSSQDATLQVPSKEWGK